MTYFENNNDGLGKFTEHILIFIIGVLLGAMMLAKCTGTKEPTNPTMVNVDSIIKVNDSIKLKVEKLDSIKDAKVIEVTTLDNDSTLKLFYKLVSE